MKTLVIYGSLTGNTEYIAQLISEKLNQDSVDHDLINVAGFSPGKILDYDTLILGCSTWDYGQLQDDFKDFFNEVQNLDFKGKKFAAFGCGESTYEEFCIAVDMIEKFWTDKNAEQLVTGLKIDGFPQQQTNQDLLTDWYQKLIKKLK